MADPLEALGPAKDIVSAVRALKVIDPELRAEEQVLWSQKANRFQSRLRAVGGKLYLTDRRLVFAVHQFDAKSGGEEWDTALSEITGVEVAGALRLVHVHLRDGIIERFVVRPAGPTAELLGAAAQEAR